ncbi:hypothetical protein ES708_10554 [subsurface metagenome]
MSATKICSREDCQHLGEPQPISNFYKDNLRPAGYKTYCKDCDLALSQTPQSRATRARYRQSPAGKATATRFSQSQKGRTYYARAASLHYQANKLSCSISIGINRSLKGRKNGFHWEDLVDFTLNDLMHHLEKQFTDGMTWDNYGKWHIDHIIPITAFNFSSVKDYDFKRCWALNNLRPLWEADNIHKSDKVVGGFQPSLI